MSFDDFGDVIGRMIGRLYNLRWSKQAEQSPALRAYLAAHLLPLDETLSRLEETARQREEASR
jgi:hypothetical protein